MATQQDSSDRPHGSVNEPPFAPHRWESGFGLPGVYYWSPQQFAADIRRVFYRNWLFVGHTCQIPEPGDYFSFAIGRDSILVVRDEASAVHALFNSCRHRGSRLCDAPSGHMAKIVCPYHQWVYGLDGSLQSCRMMNEEIDRSDYPLHQARIEVVQGFIFFCLSDAAPDFKPARDAFDRFFAPHDSENIRVALEQEYLVEANWKTIFDNNRECYHCATGHREFCLSNFDFGMPGDPRSSDEFVRENARMQEKWAALGLEQGPVNFPNGEWFRCMRFPLKPGFVTESLNGQPVAPVIGDFADHDIGSLRVVGLPNMWFHLNSDYFMTTRLIPVAPTKTQVKVAWYVRRDAGAGVDFDPARVADVWRITGEQDWKLCEMNQAGMQSTRFVPGPLSQEAEQGISHFIGWYFRQLEGDTPAAELCGAAEDQAWFEELQFEDLQQRNSVEG
ncbi:MAG: aromatic ring-hydroxylating dioxygenase subunit alpha [Pirellulales bacterium]